MSTPVYSHTPPRVPRKFGPHQIGHGQQQHHHQRPPKKHVRTPTAELSEQMQRMIEIQNQHFDEYDYDDEGRNDGDVDGGGVMPLTDSALEQHEQQLKHHHQYQHDEETKTPYPSHQTSSVSGLAAAVGSVAVGTNDDNDDEYDSELEVGTGTLIFSSAALASGRYRLDSSSSLCSSTFSPPQHPVPAQTTPIESRSPTTSSGVLSAFVSTVSGGRGGAPPPSMPPRPRGASGTANASSASPSPHQQHQQQVAMHMPTPPPTINAKSGRALRESLAHQLQLAGSSASSSRPGSPFGGEPDAAAKMARTSTNYGALHLSGETNSKNNSSQNMFEQYQRQQQQEQQQHQHQNTSPRHPQQQEHDFHYGNPDVHLFGTHVDDGAYELHPQRYRRGRSNRKRCSSCCSRSWGRFVDGWRQFYYSEAVRRSFCLGAIDGMLTGSGIVSAFCGMQLLDADSGATSNANVYAVVLVFTAAACFADSLCMGIGHVWTSRVAAASHAREREAARAEFSRSRALAKGRLVDMLLARGVLKMDAMSLADTLEGYPDLFIGALIGEAIVGEVGSDDDSSAVAVSAENPTGMIVPGEDTHMDTDLHGLQYYHSVDHPPPPPPHHYSDSIPRLHSYGRLTPEQMEPPEELAAADAARESRQESVMMMISFTMFAVLPAAIVTLVMAVHNDVDSGHSHPSSKKRVATVIAPQSIAIAITACIIWGLGIWKSHFLDASWLVFGIETVLVLLVCIAAAYGAGALLKYWFLPEDYVLQARPDWGGY